jgi:hypothetical protein
MSSVSAITTAGTFGLSVSAPIGYNVLSSGLAPIITTDGYALYRFHSNGTMNLSGIIAKYGPATLQVMCVGGGSGGASSGNSGAGGSAGGFIETTLTITTGQIITVTIGNGGANLLSGQNTSISFSNSPEYNMISYGGTTTGSGAPTAYPAGICPQPGYYGGGGGGGSAGKGPDGVPQNGGNGGPGTKPTKPGISTQYPTTYWAAGGGGYSGWSYGTYGGIGGGGGGRGGVYSDQGSNGYSPGSSDSGSGQVNSGSGGGVSGAGGSGIVMIAVKIPTYETPPNVTNTNAPNFLTTNNNSISQQYACLSMSSSGKYILANIALTTTSGFLYLSTDFGTNFTIINSLTGKYNKSSAISSTGQCMVVVQGSSYMYRSSDYGTTWTQVASISATQNWTSVALSKDGKYCLANGNSPTNNIFVSSNFDIENPTFTQISLYTTMNSAPYYNVVSMNGQRMIQLCWGSTITDGIAISSNYGVSFTKLTIANIGITGTNNYNFSGIAMTPDSNNVYIPCYSNGLYKSTNLFSGSPSFTKITSATFTEQTWNSVVVSSDGTYVVASTDAKVYYSTNSGVTWTVCFTGTTLGYMALSDNARYCVGLSKATASKLFLSTNI